MSAHDDLRRQHPYSPSYRRLRSVQLGSSDCPHSSELQLQLNSSAGHGLELRQFNQLVSHLDSTVKAGRVHRSTPCTRRGLQYQDNRLHYLFIYVLLLMVNQLFQAEAMEPVYPQPVFLHSLANVTARPGGKAVLPCAVHYLGTKQVTWRKMGDPHFLSVGDQTWVKDSNLHLHYNEITPEVTEWNLVIKNATPEHSGTYECKITDLVQLVRYVDLNVSGDPVVESVTRPPIAVSGKNYVERGQALHLFCNTTGPDGVHLKIDWFKDGDRIDYINYRQVVITNYNLVEKNILVSELLIDRSQASDTGTYICRSTNGHIESIKVTVLLADTNNVKRGYVSREESYSSTTSVRQCLPLVITMTLFTWAGIIS